MWSKDKMNEFIESLFSHHDAKEENSMVYHNLKTVSLKHLESLCIGSSLILFLLNIKLTSKAI